MRRQFQLSVKLPEATCCVQTCAKSPDLIALEGARTVVKGESTKEALLIASFLFSFYP